MKLDPDKPITCEAADDAFVVGRINGETFLVYSKTLEYCWYVNSEGYSKTFEQIYHVHNAPEKTNEHWYPHYETYKYIPNGIHPSLSLDYCVKEYPDARWYTNHWLEDGEPKCEIVKPTPDHAPYVPSHCYENNNPPMCSCGHHHGYHNSDGQCLHAVHFTACGCTGYDGEDPDDK